MATLIPPLLRRAVRIAPPATDAELLDRFAAGRDEDAFAELVRRHGPVVFRVCRRLVGPSAADDAFQASFLVLATQLDKARAAAALGGWLVGVAARVAGQMRRAASRRAFHETVAGSVAPRIAEQPDRCADLTDQFRALDEEIARLPDRLRDPVVLCLLQGRTQEQAAGELGRDARTLRRRLERAKVVLRARLERRGVVPAVAVALAIGAGSVSATVPSALGARTVAAVFDFLTGGTGAARSAPVSLAKGVAMSMFARKVMRLMVVAAAGLVGLGAVLAGDDPVPVPPPVAQPVAAAPPVAAEKPPRAKAAAPAKANERSVMVEAMCVRVPVGFSEKCGLAENASESAWMLSPRETRMLQAIIRAEPKQEVLCHPRLITLDNQTAIVQVGGEVPYVASEEEAKDRKAGKFQRIAFQPVGLSLQVTPRVSADGKLIQLRVETQHTQAAPTQVDLGNGVKATAFNSQKIETTIALSDGGTAVLHAGYNKSADGKGASEQLWVLTAHVLRDAEKVEPPARVAPVPAPARSAPPVVPAPVPMFRPVPKSEK